MLSRAPTYGHVMGRRIDDDFEGAVSAAGAAADDLEYDFRGPSSEGTLLDP